MQAPCRWSFRGEGACGSRETERTVRTDIFRDVGVWSTLFYNLLFKSLIMLCEHFFFITGPLDSAGSAAWPLGEFCKFMWLIFVLPTSTQALCSGALFSGLELG